MEVSRIIIKNFKNLKDVEIRPKKFNVLIGPNGSGKTNFIEFFKLLRKIYVEKNPYPFLDWDGYRNVVWNHKINLPIQFMIETVEKINLSDFINSYLIEIDDEIEKKIKKEDVPIQIFRRISADFWADSENLRILRESIEVEIPELNYHLLIEKRGNIWRVKFNGKEHEVRSEDIEVRSIHFEIIQIIEEGLRLSDYDYLDYIEDCLGNRIGEFFVELLAEDVMKNFEAELEKSFPYKEVYLSIKKELKKINERKRIGIDVKISKISKEDEDIKRWLDYTLLYWYKYINLRLSINLLSTMYKPFIILYNTIFLFSLNIIEIKYRRKITPVDQLLSERGENALDILYLIQFKNGKLPERIEYLLNTFFNCRGYFKERNFYVYDLSKRIEIPKEHLPDGLIKALVILTALEQKPTILLIDEIENSLHPDLLEFIVNVLKEENVTIFITTHSPTVLNLVDPEEIWICKPTDEEIKIKNATEFKSKEELLKELDELGITLGEKIFYGLT